MSEAADDNHLASLKRSIHLSPIHRGADTIRARVAAITDTEEHRERKRTKWEEADSVLVATVKPEFA